MKIVDILWGTSQEVSSDLIKDESSRQPFLDDETTQMGWTEKTSPSQHQGTRLISLIGTALLSIAMTAVVLFAIFPHTSQQFRPTASVVQDQILDCGTTAEEARSKGCVFDIMQYSWTPVPCYNQTLSEEYWQGLVDGGIEFWDDPLKTHVLSHEDILAAKYEYSYTSWLLHLKHCQYLIHRQLQQLTYGTPVDNVSRNISHSEHCLEEIRRPSDVKTMLFTGTAYLRCAQGIGDIGSIYWNDPPAQIEIQQRLF